MCVLIGFLWGRASTCRMAGCGVLMPLMFVSSWCCGNERVHGEWLLLMRVDAIEVHLERVLWNGASAWGMAGFDVL